MGLFSGLRGKGVEGLDLPTAVMVRIVATMLADGDIDDNEINQIRSICAWSPIYARNTHDQDTEIILSAIKRVQSEGVEAVCRQAAELLSLGLRETSFIFAVRMFFANGYVGTSEESLIEQFVDWLGINETRGRSFVEAVSVMQHSADA